MNLISAVNTKTDPQHYCIPSPTQSKPYSRPLSYSILIPSLQANSRSNHANFFLYPKTPRFIPVFDVFNEPAR